MRDTNRGATMQITPTLEDQMKHIKKIETLLEKFKDKKFPGLTEDEVFTIIRALSCHDAVIRFDVKKRRKKDD